MSNVLIKKLGDYATKEGIDLNLWEKEAPHFGGGLPHRYQATANEYVGTQSSERVCVYCLRPENLNQGSKKNEK
ncbi:MAG: hypothetical protein KDD52_09250 [Bdellovibrionales bacterium]|nr:hypothetical protein [Bdellovibrionales bacterium]